MREILFRAWDSENNVMASIDELNGDFVFIKDDDYVRSQLSWQDVFNGDHPAIIPMQFSGLKDKKGRYIFESDILMDCITKAIYIVKFGHCKTHGFTGWYVSYLNTDNKDGCINGDYDTNKNSQIEVIGNLYESPELLKEEK